MYRTRSIVSLLVIALVALAAMAPVASAKGTERIIALKGSSAFPGANGKAKYKVGGGEREFQVEVEDVRRLAGKRVTVFANGNRVGTALVNRFGDARLSRNTDLGQRVPTVVNGSRVAVRTASGTLVVSGSC